MKAFPRRLILCAVIGVIFLSGMNLRAFSADADAGKNTALIPTPKIEQDSYDWYARHDAVLKAKDQIQPEIVMIGDSITHFWSGKPEAQLQNGKESWRQLFGDRAVLNMGFGWDRTQNVLWRLEKGEFDGLHPKYVVMNIGTNNFAGTANAKANTPAEIAEAIDAICAKLHEKSPQTKIILMGVFPRGEKPEDPCRAQIAALNQLLPDVAQKHQAVFLDIGKQLLNPDGTIPKSLMFDFCHPTDQGYAVWAKAIKPLLGD